MGDGVIVLLGIRDRALNCFNFLWDVGLDYVRLEASE